MHIPDPSQIDLTPATPDSLTELTDLFVDLFTDREPLTRLIGLSRERMRELAAAKTGGAGGASRLQAGWNWLARDRQANGRAVGFVVCDDPAVTPETLPQGLSAAEQATLEAVMAFLEEIRRPLAQQVRFEPGACLHIAAIGVAPGYEGQGLATRLLRAALDSAKAHGFETAFAECTGPASAACHARCGFTCLHTVNAAEVIREGRALFPGQDLAVQLLIRPLA